MLGEFLGLGCSWPQPPDPQVSLEPVVDRTQQVVSRSGIFALADVNRDGKPSVIFIENNYLEEKFQHLTYFSMKQADRHCFGPSGTFRSARDSLRRCKRDFNRDSWADVVALDAADGKLTFLLNDRQWKLKKCLAGLFVHYSHAQSAAGTCH
jgi:hypothetical protein